MTETFTSDYKATIGADFRTKEIKCDNERTVLQFWDTASQERLNNMLYRFIVVQMHVF